MDCFRVLRPSVVHGPPRPLITRIAETAVPLVCEPLATKRKPHNSYAASFSLPYAVACCLMRGRFGLKETEEAAFTDPALLNLAQKVSYEIDPDAGFPAYRSGEVIVRMRDGRVLSQRKNILPQDRAPESAVVQKFMDNTRHALTPARACWQGRSPPTPGLTPPDRPPAAAPA